MGKSVAMRTAVNVTGESSLSGSRALRRACVSTYPESMKNQGTQVKPQPKK